MEWQHRYILVNGIRMHYVEHGNGPLVILMHGFPEFWYSWRYQIPALAQAGFRVVAVDMRGYNETDSPQEVSAYKAETLTQDIADLVHALGETKAHIVGHDWGGGVAWNLAKHHPEVIDKLVVMNCPIPAILSQHLRSNFTQLKKSWYMFFFQIPGLPEKAMGKDLGSYLAKAFRGWAYNKDNFKREDIAQYVEAFEKSGLTGPMNYYRAALREGLKKENRTVKPIDVDTLLIWGEGDKALGKELTYNMEQYFTKDFQLKYIPNCSHWVQNDAPEQVNEYLIDFLKPETTPQ